MANLGLITNLCYEKKKSKNELAEFLGLTHATLCKIQKVNDCSISQLETIAKFFDTDVNEFFLFPKSDSTPEQFRERFNLFFNDIKEKQICNSIVSFASYLNYYNPDNSLISKYLSGKIDIPEHFILFLLRKFDNLNPQWFLCGVGEMYSERNNQVSTINKDEKFNDLQKEIESLKATINALKEILKCKL